MCVDEPDLGGAGRCGVNENLLALCRFGFRLEEGNSAAAGREFEEALAAWEAALDIARDLNDRHRIVTALEQMGLAAAQIAARDHSIRCVARCALCVAGRGMYLNP